MREPSSAVDPQTPGTQAEGKQPEPDPEALELVPGGVKGAIEAILMVADRAVSDEEFAQALMIPTDRAEQALMRLQQEYDGRERPSAAEQEQSSLGAEPRGMELRRVAGGWRLYSRPEYAQWVGRFILEGQTAKLSRAAVETLAVIAYRQPVSRGRISSIRGVSVDGVIRTLKARGLIAEAEQPGESGATLFETTPMFLEKIGLESLDQLPKISPYLPDVQDVGEYENQEARSDSSA